MTRISTASILLLAAGIVVSGAAYANGAGRHHGHHGHHRPPPVLIAFHSMYGVDGPFVGEANPVDDIVGDELPWEVRGFARGRVTTEGNVVVLVRGLVFKDEPSVPPELRGKNDESEFRAAVSCLTEDGDEVVRRNVVTPGAPADEHGNSVIIAHVELPNPCVAPAVFVLAGSEDKWFAATGFEEEEDE